MPRARIPQVPGLTTGRAISVSNRYFLERRFLPTSGLPTIGELLHLMDTSAFVGTNSTDEPVTSGLPAILTQWGALRDVCGRQCKAAAMWSQRRSYSPSRYVGPCSISWTPFATQPSFPCAHVSRCLTLVITSCGLPSFRFGMARTYCCVVQTVASLPVSQALDPRVRSIDVDAQNTVEIFLHSASFRLSVKL